MKKLVRDLVPHIIMASGETPPPFHRAGQQGRALHLKMKLVEEVKEYQATPNAEELADIYEVLRNLADYHGGWAHVVKVADDKRASRGSFRDGIVMDFPPTEPRRKVS